MLINEPVVGFKHKSLIPLLILILGVMICSSESSQASSHFQLEKDPQGLIRPFKAIAIPLPEFVREYGRVTSTHLIVGGNWDQELKGTVTLFLRSPLKNEKFTEIFYRVLADHGYAVVDGPAGNGLLIKSARDARDHALPVYEATEVPDSSRLVTAYRNLKYANAEHVARMMRSFMPPNSRIIPTSKSQVFITDVASNIRKLNLILARMDTQEVAKRQGEVISGPVGPPKSCGEHRIEKLVVEKLEIQESNPVGSVPQIKSAISGGKK